MQEIIIGSGKKRFNYIDTLDIVTSGHPRPTEDLLSEQDLDNVAFCATVTPIRLTTICHQMRIGCPVIVGAKCNTVQYLKGPVTLFCMHCAVLESCSAQY